VPIDSLKADGWRAAASGHQGPGCVPPCEMTFFSDALGFMTRRFDFYDIFDPCWLYMPLFMLFYANVQWNTNVHACWLCYFSCMFMPGTTQFEFGTCHMHVIQNPEGLVSLPSMTCIAAIGSVSLLFMTCITDFYDLYDSVIFYNPRTYLIICQCLYMYIPTFDLYGPV